MEWVIFVLWLVAGMIVAALVITIYFLTTNNIV